MPVNYLTGSQTERFEEISQRWLVFSAPTTDKFTNYALYGVPSGQTFSTTMLLDTGSVTFVSGAVQIVKDIHLFESENEASKFVNEIGTENIASVSVRSRPAVVDGAYVLKTVTEIQLANVPEISFDLDLLDGEVKRGFKVEVFHSGSNGLTEVQRLPEINLNGVLISDTFLKYFEIEEQD
jgi:hypothetical protein